MLDCSVALAWRFRRRGDGESARFLDLLGNLPIDVDGAPELPTLPLLMEIARDHRLSAYDTAYLALAARERLPLATRDTALRRSATTIGVPSFTPSDRA